MICSFLINFVELHQFTLAIPSFCRSYHTMNMLSLRWFAFFSSSLCSYINSCRLFHHFAELSTPWISLLWGDLQFSRLCLHFHLLEIINTTTIDVLWGDYRHAGLTRVRRKGNPSPPSIRARRKGSSTRFQFMKNLLFVKRLLCVFTSSRPSYWR